MTVTKIGINGIASGMGRQRVDRKSDSWAKGGIMERKPGSSGMIVTQVIPPGCRKGDEK